MCTCLVACPRSSPVTVAGAVPDLHRLPMRAVREQLHAAGLLLEAHGSGVAVAQGPLAGAVVPKGTQVHVNFRRLSEATESVNAAAVEHP